MEETTSDAFFRPFGGMCSRFRAASTTETVRSIPVDDLQSLASQGEEIIVQQSVDLTESFKLHSLWRRSAICHLDCITMATV